LGREKKRGEGGGEGKFRGGKWGELVWGEAERR